MSSGTSQLLGVGGGGFWKSQSIINQDKAVLRAAAKRTELNRTENGVFNLQLYFPCQGYDRAKKGIRRNAAHNEFDNCEAAAYDVNDIAYNVTDDTRINNVLDHLNLFI